MAASISYSRSASSTFSSYERSIDERCHSMSAPAQKLSPSPVSTTARASPTSANASVSSADQLGVERVPPLGLRDRDAQDVPVSLDAERAHARELRVGAC